MAKQDLPLDEYHRAGLEITNGNPDVYKSLYSRSGDVTLANPFGPPARGWSGVSATLDRAADNYRDGEVVGFENVATVMGADLAYIVEIESYRARVGGRGDDSGIGPGHQRLPTRGRTLEAAAQARRPDHRAAPARVRPPDIALAQTSSTIVTGPSLTSSTAIMAPNDPRATGTPSAASSSQKRS